MQAIANLTSPERSEAAVLRALHAVPMLRRHILAYAKNPEASQGKKLAIELQGLQGWLPSDTADSLERISELMIEGSPLVDDTVIELLNTIDPHVFTDIWKSVFEAKSIVDDYLKPGSRHSDIALRILQGETKAHGVESRLRQLEEFIYRHPGLYKSQLASAAAQSASLGVSESRIQQYVDVLAERGDILTIGGPQGNLRFCFPNPSKVRDRRQFYGKRFGIHGTVKAIQQETQFFEREARFGQFGVVNSNMMDIGVFFPVGSLRSAKDVISGFGILRPIEGYVPSNLLEPMGVLESLHDLITPMVIEEKVPESDNSWTWIDTRALTELETIS